MKCLVQVALRAFTLLVAAASSSAFALSLAVTNPSFEARVLTCAAGPNCFILGDIPGWAVSTVPQTATFKPSIGSGGIYPSGVPDGFNVAAVGNQDGAGSISQVLADVLTPDTAYTLSAAIGYRADFPFSGYSLDLLAGQTLLASASGLTPAVGSFLFDSLTFQSTASTLGIGQPLSIRLRSLIAGAQADFDVVTLTAAPVPEPSVVLMLLAGLGLLAAAGGRRKP